MLQNMQARPQREPGPNVTSRRKTSGGGRNGSTIMAILMKNGNSQGKAWDKAVWLEGGVALNKLKEKEAPEESGEAEKKK